MTRLSSTARLARYLWPLLASVATAMGAGEPASDLRRAMDSAIQKGDVGEIVSLVEAGFELEHRDTYGDTPLFTAVSFVERPSASLETLLALGADPNALDEKGWTPLLRALELGETRPVAILLAGGADVRAVTPSGETALAILERTAGVFDFVADDQADIEALLLAAGAPPDLPIARLRRELIAAVTHGNAEEVDRLIAAGADVDAAKDDYHPVLIQAIRDDYGDIARALLQAGADPNRLDLDFATSALAQAVANADTELVRLLFEAGARPRMVGRHGRPITLPLQRMESAEMLAILEAGGVEPAKLRSARLQLAAFTGDYELFETVLADGKGLDISNIWEISLLHQAAGRGHAELVRRLIGFGADLEATSSDGTTPLAWASYSGDLDTVEQLLAAGADPDGVVGPGRSALISALWQEHAEIALALVKAGADPSLADTVGTTALSLATQRGYRALVEALIAAGADVDTENEDGDTPMMIAIAEGHDEIAALLEAAGSTSEGSTEARTRRAVREGDVEAARLGLAAGVDPNLRHGAGGLLCSAVESTAVETTAVETAAVEIVRLLLEAGADPDVRCHGDWLLAAAAYEGRLELVRLLVEAGADPNAESGHRHTFTALDIAVRDGHADIARFLAQAGAEPKVLTPEELGGLSDEELLARFSAALPKVRDGEF